MQALGIDIGGSSVKLAAVRADQKVAWTNQSRTYARPDRSQLIAAIQFAILGRIETGEKIPAVGLCIPGIPDSAGERVTASVNVPGLVGIPLRELIESALGQAVSHLTIVNDAAATSADVVISKNLSDRVIVIALGTGVGMGVLDAPDRWILVDGNSPGHIGQFDVSLDDDAPIGPDGGAGRFEAYIGAPALIAKYGAMDHFFNSVNASDAPIRALARAIRICHAIYRPNHVVLAGGIGVRLSPVVGELKKLVDRNLTQIARRDWTLSCAEHDFHAAIGAARAAASAPA